jgi:hypothetical protein
VTINVEAAGIPPILTAVVDNIDRPTFMTVGRTVVVVVVGIAATTIDKTKGINGGTTRMVTGRKVSIMWATGILALKRICLALLKMSIGNTPGSTLKSTMLFLSKPVVMDALNP